MKVILVALSLALMGHPGAAQDGGNDELARRAIERRAIEAVIWGMPAVNYHLMYQQMADKTGGDYNEILFWSGLLDWRNQTLTPNPDVIYLMPFFNTEEVGPVVLEIPPADDGVFNGSVMNYWQTAIEDVGPGGMDKGKGGKYLILPPGHDGQIPAGYIPMPSDTYRGYALLRSVLKSGSDADIAKAVEYGRRVKVYPLSQADNPPETVFHDAKGMLIDSRIPYDIRFFEALDAMVQAEPWLERDRAMIDQLKTIGIERGKPFAPDTETQKLLVEAAVEARAWLDSRYDALPPFYDGEHWFFPVTEEMHQSVMNFWTSPESYPVDARGLAYMLAFFSAKHLGESQYYLLTSKDADGNQLAGGSTYRLRVPADVPVTQYWSMAVYNRDTHTFILEAPRAGRSSQSPGLQANADGSVDIFFGPDAPEGRDSNWTPTDPDGRFEVLARFYGPTAALFDKSWKLPDLEKLE